MFAHFVRAFAPVVETCAHFVHLFAIFLPTFVAGGCIVFARVVVMHFFIGSFLSVLVRWQYQTMKCFDIVGWVSYFEML